MKINNYKCQKWYESSYKKTGFLSQRMYPNEELLRFFGRELFPLNKNKRRKIKILEIGCGSGANLWMIAKEGFQTFGIDLSKKSLQLTKKMLEKWRVKADLKLGNMTNLPCNNSEFDIIVDVFSSNCLCVSDYEKCIKEVSRVLKKGGRFFSYIPSTNSDAFKKYKPAKKIDDYTLNGIYRKSSPYYGNFYPFRFTDANLILNVASKAGLQLEYDERVTRTYSNKKETFEFLAVVLKNYRQLSGKITKKKIFH